MVEHNTAPRPMTVDQMKAFSHPLRMRLYRLLQDQGQATASMLARQTGESSGQTSYHLRQLEKFGFVKEAGRAGSGRQRWWEALSFAYEDVSLEGQGVSQAVSEWTVESVAEDLRRSSVRDEDDPVWAEAGTVTSHTQWMTAGELQALTEELLEVIRRHSTAAGAARAGKTREGERRTRVFVHSFALPVVKEG